MSSDSYELPDSLREGGAFEPKQPDLVAKLAAEAARISARKFLYSQLRRELFPPNSQSVRQITISRSGGVIWSVQAHLEGDLLVFVMPVKYAGHPEDKHLYDPETCFVLMQTGLLLMQPEHIDQMIVRMEREEHIFPHRPPHQQALSNLVGELERWFGLGIPPPEGEEWHWQTYMRRCGDVTVETV